MRGCHGEEEMVDEELFISSCENRTGETRLRILRGLKKLISDSVISKTNNGKLLMKPILPYLTGLPPPNTPTKSMCNTEKIIRDFKRKENTDKSITFPQPETQKAMEMLKALVLEYVCKYIYKYIYIYSY
jgi:hypothetical protein